jgi:FkbM family methyltransferase
MGRLFVATHFHHRKVSMKLEVPLPHIYTQAGYEFLWNYLHQHDRNTGPGGFDQDRLGFLSFCMNNLAHSKAQLYQDLYVLYKLNSKKNGFFVEFGATNGLALSNTYLLEKTMGWMGILAEPFPIWHAELAANRSAAIDHRCVWSRTGETQEFLGTDYAPEYATLLSYRDQDKHHALRSHSSNVLLVQTVSLNDLLAQHKAPKDLDYLSVDTEGSEFEILSHLDFKRYRPKLLSVEHNFNVEMRGKLFDLLSAQGYVREFEEFSRFDDWYCLKA